MCIYHKNNSHDKLHVIYDGMHVLAVKERDFITKLGILYKLKYRFTNIILFWLLALDSTAI